MADLFFFFFFKNWNQHQPKLYLLVIKISTLNSTTVSTLRNYKILQAKYSSGFLWNSNPRLRECTSLGIPYNDNKCWGIISNIFESQQLFFERKVRFRFKLEHKLLYFSYNSAELLFEVLCFWKQTWWIEIKDNLLQCLLSSAERSSVIVIYSSCQGKSITDDIKMTYFAWATYCLNVHNLIETDFLKKSALYCSKLISKHILMS